VPSWQWNICKSLDPLLPTKIDSSLGRLLDSDSHRRIYPVVHGGPRQNDPHGRNSCEPRPPRILEDGVQKPIHSPEDRPLDYTPISDVFCQQLLLHLAFVYLFFESVWLLISYTEFNDYNAALFDIRARGLNNFVYWTSQIFGSILIGYFVLDLKSVRRRVRAFYGWVVVFLMLFVVHVWAYFYQK
jgi:hypothetical protein